MQKQVLRQHIRASLKALTKHEAELSSSLIISRLQSLDAYQRAKAVSCYISVGTEVGTHPLIQSMLKDQKRVCVPRVYNMKESIMQMHWLPSWEAYSEFASSAYGIPEPNDSDSLISSEDASLLDLIIVPGLAFDKYCHRMGHGKGFYDRFLSSLPPIPHRMAIGLCHSIQVVDSVPCSQHDVRLDMVIHPNGIFTHQDPALHQP